ncbi:MAG TPA: hypothetical protein VFI32_10670, partial [Rhodanobacteraceae bacterium]|nr:hypothetical protein [Rhodanobacteraceae bacterium]
MREKAGLEVADGVVLLYKHGRGGFVGGRMIPAFNQSGVLPPFLTGSTPADPFAVSPYETTMLHLVQRYGISFPRRKQLSGLLKMRHQLRQIGVAEAFQWIDGSFCEDIEATEDRDPGDIDVVTFGTLPPRFASVQAALDAHPELFSPAQSKQ